VSYISAAINLQTVTSRPQATSFIALNTSIITILSVAERKIVTPLIAPAATYRSAPWLPGLPAYALAALIAPRHFLGSGG